MSENITIETTGAKNADRQHYLDALRAFAMFLGIGLHASLSFIAVPWPVQDITQPKIFIFLLLIIHGFRMPLFFILSGYFTM
ncbi:glucan biosynthesis protein, partial [bacterium]|nr:glucan biosynthesis protein [bacterium]